MKMRRLVGIILVLLLGLSLSACAGQQQTKENLAGDGAVPQKNVINLGPSDMDNIVTAIMESDYDIHKIECEVMQTEWISEYGQSIILITTFPFQRKLEEGECTEGKTPEEAAAEAELINRLSNEENPSCRKVLLYVSGGAGEGKALWAIIYACKRGDSDWDIVAGMWE